MKRQLVAPRFAASRFVALVHAAIGVHVAAETPRRGMALSVHERKQALEKCIWVFRNRHCDVIL
jgi:hypothetical protein